MRLLAVFLLVSSVFLVPVAEARKIGDGGKIGRSAPVDRQAAPANNTANPQNPGANPGAARPGMGGFLGGLMVGLLAMGFVGMLLMGGGSLLLLLLIGVGVFFLVKFLMRQRNNAPQQPAYAYSAPGAASDSASEVGGYEGQGGMNVPAIGSGVGSGVGSVHLYKNAEGLELLTAPPAWFNESRFLAAATEFFHELNQAWERGDFQKISEFTTAEVLEGLRQQHIELSGDNKTFFQNVTARLLALHRDGETIVATVEFSGEEQENSFGAWSAFRQLWVIERDLSQSNAPWLIAGMEDGEHGNETGAY